MNSRALSVILLIAAIVALLFAVSQSQSLSQTQATLAAQLSTATAQSDALALQATESAATLSAVTTQAADAQATALSAAEAAALAEQSMAVARAEQAVATDAAATLSAAQDMNATAQAQAVAEVEQQFATLQAQAVSTQTSLQNALQFALATPVPTDEGLDIGTLVATTSVDRDGCPVGETDVFAPDDSIFAAMTESQFPANTAIFARMYLNGRAIEDTNEIVADRDYTAVCVNFVFENNRGFEVGSYEIEIIINGNLVGSVAFEVR
jgi:hypothetical protein